MKYAAPLIINPLSTEWDEILHVKGGYFDLLEPKYIYVNSQLTGETAEEVKLHESFHRHVSTATIYGWITGISTHVIKQLGSLQHEDVTIQRLKEFRNRVFREMYIVQEGGAVSRTLFMLRFIYNPKNTDELLRLENSFVERLTKPYKKIAVYYCGLIRSLFSESFEYIPTTLAAYTSEALAVFLMNAAHLSHAKPLQSLFDQGESFFKATSPDRRFAKISEEFSNPTIRRHFVESLNTEIVRAFGVEDIFKLGAELELERRMLTVPDDAELLLATAVDASLQSVFPEYAVPVWSEQYIECLLSWNNAIETPLEEAYPKYSRVKYSFLAKQKEKEKFQDEYVRTF